MTEPIRKLLGIISKDYHIEIDTNVDCRRDNADICKTLITSANDKSLMGVRPDIAAEWDYEKNYPLTPDKVPVRTGRKVWWICPKGHSYDSVVASRTGEEACGCRYCSGKGSAAYINGEYIGEHSLAKERPDIAAEFMESKNGISADNISVSSNKKMWFKCSKCGHEWPSKVNNRTSSNNQGCPKCGREKVRLSRCRPVVCVETNIEYESVSDAERKVGVRNISACCRGKLETSGGYHWEYKA